MKERRKVRLPEGTDWNSMSWQTIIDTFSEDLKRSEERVMSLAAGGREAEGSVKLAKKLALARLLLASKIKQMQKTGKMDAKFLVELVNLIERTEGLLGAYEEELEEWNRFLFVLIEKMKAEKLVVYDKKHVAREDFEQAKDRFSDPHGEI